MSFSRWYRKHRAANVSLMACAGFLALALWGWGVTWKDMGLYLLITVVLLGAIVGTAALAGWLLHKLRQRRRDSGEL